MQSPQPTSSSTSTKKMMTSTISSKPAAPSGNAPPNTLQHLLACYEDSSFIFNNSISDNNKHLNSSQSSSSSSSSADSVISPRSSNSSSPAPSSSSSGSSLDSMQFHGRSLPEYSDYASASPSCISALDYCHLSSSSYYANKKQQQHQYKQHTKPQADKTADQCHKLSSSSMKRSHEQLDDGDDGIVNTEEELKRSKEKHHTFSSSSCASDGQTQFLYAGTSSTNNLDPVYLEDNEVFYNLILKETSELKRREHMLISRREDLLLAATLGPCESLSSEERQTIAGNMCEASREFDEDELKVELLNGQQRHSLLSWMLKICENQQCQDEIFPLATMILDKFLLFHPNQILKQTVQAKNKINASSSPIINSGGINSNESDEFLCYDEELKERQLYLFAACSLLLAAKLRQTSKLSIQVLIEFSKTELPVNLNREEIFDGELLILATLKWDLAALVTPNDFLSLVMRKCQTLLSNFLNDNIDQDNYSESDDEENNDNSSKTTVPTYTKPHETTRLEKQQQSKMKNKRKYNFESRVKRHTQTLLELCLMDSQLSQCAPSILAMTTMAVAIDGLSSTGRACWRLSEIVTKIHEATHKVNELELMIDVAIQIENYVQKLLNSTHDD